MLAGIKKRFNYFKFFKGYLKDRVYFIMLLNIVVGLLDGLGLSMFLPLLHYADGNNAAQSADGGRFHVFVAWLENWGVHVDLKVTLLLITVFFVLKGVAYYIKGAYQTITQQYFIKKIRIKGIGALSEMSYQHFTLSDSGRIQNTLTTEIERMARASQAYFLAFQHLILVVVYVLFAFWLNWKFALMVCLGGLVIDFLYGKIYQKTKGVSRKLTDGNSLLQGLISNYINSYKYLKATGTIGKYQSKLNNQVTDIELNNRKIGIMAIILSASREPLSIIVLSVVIIFQVSLLNAPFATILVSLLFFYRALSSLMQYQTAWNTFLGVAGSLENTEQLIKEFENHKDLSGGRPFTGFEYNIMLDKVGYMYSQRMVLKNISFAIKKNESVAIVGPSGSGKSTLVNLITGLLKVSAGEIRIDGLNLKEINLASFQQRIGYITQDAVIFNDTIYNNVTLWAEKTEVHLQNFREACKAAAIWDFVQTAEDCEQELLGTNGINLSGGQKQRIAVARELFKKVDLLIMDEATSAMDYFTEQEIQESIQHLKGKVTMISIAHRLSTIKNADKIIYLNDGAMAEIGTFDGLFSANESFKKMVDLQAIS
jgi:subfamily B ATP-binding cassette protein MsbA